jgi:ABC-2 type transport system permease protein
VNGNTSARSAFGPLGAGVRNGFVEFGALFTWRSWTFGWLVRVGSQAALYGLLGKMLGSVTHQRYLFVGASMLVCATEALLVCASTVSERCTGTLSLIEASPVGTFGVLAGRGVQFLPGGVVTSLTCLLLIGPAFELVWTPGQVAAVLPLVLLTSVATYCLGLALGAVVLSAPGLRNVVTGIVAAGSPVACGVVAPLQQWPPLVRAVGMTVPLTHTLAAVRHVAGGGQLSECVGEAAAALFAAGGWLLAAWLIVRWTLTSARRRGSMEIGG